MAPSRKHGEKAKVSEIESYVRLFGIPMSIYRFERIYRDIESLLVKSELKDNPVSGKPTGKLTA